VRKPSPTRWQAARRALKQEGTAAASHEALSRQAHRSARNRGAVGLQRAAWKAARTKGAAGWSKAAHQAARTRARRPPK